ncbi:MAG: three-Cys-motif partner protein TcmP [Balneolales bacterium]|nr:three-Cys-motif partner protein TcmP [Balneolales bacterium]
MKQFGGDWTKVKIEMLVEYAQAYLTIMKKHHYWRTLYFDGFAGSGLIIKDSQEHFDVSIGAARRIVEIENPKSFDAYYFVEKNQKNCEMLEETTKKPYPNKSIFIVNDDCNKKLKSMAEYMKKPKGERDYDKVLAYIDPYGMQLEWSSVEALKGIGADAWILIPTGMGVNRLLKNNGEINETWLKRLEIFLGMSGHEINQHFYNEETVLTLFGEEKKKSKTEKTADKASELYKNRLKEIFKFVSEPMALKNDRNSTMYHLIFVSNNAAALNIATDIINKYSN